MGCKIEHDQVRKSVTVHFGALTDSFLGQEQSGKPSTLHELRDGYHHQSRRLCHRPNKSHEDDRNLFSLVLMFLFLPFLHAILLLSLVANVF